MSITSSVTNLTCPEKKKLLEFHPRCPNPHHGEQQVPMDFVQFDKAKGVEVAVYTCRGFFESGNKRRKCQKKVGYTCGYTKKARIF